MRKYFNIIVLFIICFLFLNKNIAAYQKAHYYGGQYRDPFKSLIPKSPKVDRGELNLKVEGIVWNTDKPSAIIDGEVYHIGDLVSGAKIEGISKDGILVFFNGQNFLVNMGGE